MKRADWSREKAFRIDDDGCLIWRGSQHAKGHPTIYLGPGQQRILRRAVLALIKGRPLKRSERAIVTCGKPLCCSPNCLRAVSHSQIGKIAIAKNDWTKDFGRRLKIAASRTWARKWSTQQIDDMRRREAEGESRRAIAESLGTTPSHLWHIFEYRTNTLHLPQSVRFAMAKPIRKTACT